MTTHQPPAQPDYLAELVALGDDMNRVHARLTAIMRIFETRPPDGEAGSDEWADCYRAFQALHLATQLVHVARDNEQARRAPVPFLPAEVAGRTAMDPVYGEDEIVDAFLDAQHADFSRTQVKRMAADASRTGQSKDYGDGYMIYRVEGGFRATVPGIGTLPAPRRGE